MLRDLNAQEAVDQDVVRGKLAHLFSGLPADVLANKHEEAMHANGMCRVMVLERLKEAHLQDLGINLGDAIMILAAIYEREAQIPPPAAAADPGAAAGLVAAAAHRKLPEMRPFPKLGPTGYNIRTWVRGRRTGRHCEPECSHWSVWLEWHSWQ